MTLRVSVTELRSLEVENNCKLRIEDAREHKIIKLIECGKIDYIIDTYISYSDAYTLVKDIFPKENCIILFNTTIYDVVKIGNLLEKYSSIE